MEIIFEILQDWRKHVQVMADPEWTHLGFIWFTDAGSVLYPHMARMMEQIDEERETVVNTNYLEQR